MMAVYKWLPWVIECYYVIDIQEFIGTYWNDVYLDPPSSQSWHLTPHFAGTLNFMGFIVELGIIP